MKKTSISIIVGVILGVLISLGYLFFRKEPKVVDPELEQKKEEVIALKQIVDTLEVQLDSLRATKPERIEIVKRLPPVERVVYIEKKLDEVDSTRTDSISFLPSDSTMVGMTVEDLSRVNSIIEEREVLKEEVTVLDSIVSKKDSIIILQDTIITKQDTVIIKQGKTIKKQKKKILGISVGSGTAIAALLLLLLL